MSALADINATLQQQLVLMTAQAKEQKITSQNINSLKNRIADILAQQRADKIDALEEKREKRKKDKSSMPTGFMTGIKQGSGITGLMDMLSSALGSVFGKAGGLGGLLTGAIGLVAGKAIKWGIIGTLIATFLGDEIMGWAETLKDFTGIDLAAAFEEHPLLFSALGFLAAEILTKSILKGGARLIGFAATKVGSGIVGLFKGGKTPTPTPRSSTGPVSRGKPRTTLPKPAATGGANALTPAMRKAIASYDAGKLPSGFTRTPSGKVVNQATGKYAKVADVVGLIEAEQAAKFAKYAKILKFLGAAGSVFAAGIDPAMAIYNGESDEEIKKQLVGALGSLSGAALGAALGAAGVTAIPGVGQTGIANILGGLGGAVVGSLAGEWLVEKLADYLLGMGSSSPDTIPTTPEQINEAAAMFGAAEPFGIGSNEPYYSTPAPAATAPAPRAVPALPPNRALLFAKPSTSGSDLAAGAAANNATPTIINNNYGGGGGGKSGGGGVVPMAATEEHTLDLLDARGR